MKWKVSEALKSILSYPKKRRRSISIVPELTKGVGEEVSFLDFIPEETILGTKDFLWLRERIQAVHDEALSPQAIIAQEQDGQEYVNLEQKLIDGSEFTVRALDFHRIEFR
jgi:hypothetical protein